jgi:hypothetical protein
LDHSNLRQACTKNTISIELQLNTLIRPFFEPTVWNSLSPVNNLGGIGVTWVIVVLLCNVQCFLHTRTLPSPRVDQAEPHSGGNFRHVFAWSRPNKAIFRASKDGILVRLVVKTENFAFWA